MPDTLIITAKVVTLMRPCQTVRDSHTVGDTASWHLHCAYNTIQPHDVCDILPDGDNGVVMWSLHEGMQRGITVATILFCHLLLYLSVAILTHDILQVKMVVFPVAPLDKNLYFFIRCLTDVTRQLRLVHHVSN